MLKMSQINYIRDLSNSGYRIGEMLSDWRNREEAETRPQDSPKIS